MIQSMPVGKAHGCNALLRKTCVRAGCLQTSLHVVPTDDMEA